mgnify:CR=1 FL=1
MQSTVADCVCEAEYLAAWDAVKEMSGYECFLGEIGVASFFVEPVLLFCDGIGTISREYFIEPYIFCDVIILFKNVLEQGDIDLRKIDAKEKLS